MKHFYYVFAILLAVNIASTAQVTKAKKSTKPKNDSVEKVVATHPIDSTGILINAAIKGIRSCAINLLGQPQFKSIEVSKDYPMIITLLKPIDGNRDRVEDYISTGTYDSLQVNVAPSTSIEFIKNVQIGIKLPSTGNQGQYVEMGSMTGYIISGEFVLTGEYLVSGKYLTFENAKIVFSDNTSMGSISEGAICALNGTGYKYLQGIWVKNK